MGKFKVFRDKSKGWRFRLVASNGECILASESYVSKRNVLRGIEAVKSNSRKFDRFVIHTKKRFFIFTYHWFTLVSRNGKVVGVSEIYSTKAGIRNGIQSVTLNAYGSEVEYV